ncbi:FAD-dependent oxidoreductase [Chondrinema litorale]|uniref:FAD-dependent oxidoreductase n=1 Tax=Chondrinema litorale TaxID=2994555 RepID=UPI0025433A3F|nr:FAD-dependent oxidoreductase [Chondrinema litorale]UZR98323.1 FAD-dependent oxidoreductase [Chondrinema litorale]
MRNTCLKILVLLLLFHCQPIQNVKEKSYDLVIYGGTSAGIIAAVQAARMDHTAIIVVPEDRIGGAMSGGLGWSDIGEEETIGGLSLEFFKRVYQYYQQDSAWKFQAAADYKPYGNHVILESGIMWTFEPEVAKRIFEQMLSEEKDKIEIVYNERIDLKAGVIKENNVITSIKTESGKEYKGKYFIDASYEADLMAQAGVSYHVGRESSSTYNEELAGVLGPTIDVRQPKHLFGAGISPYDSAGNLLPGIQDVPMGNPGDGDHKIQAYNFRACLTTATENQIPIPKPENYDPLNYELLYRYIKKKDLKSIHDVITISPMPNYKTDINDGGHGSPFSTDYNGMNWDFPEGDYATRECIWTEHYNFTVGLFYFLGHDSRLPEEMRNEMLKYGLPKDEYTQYGNWTPQLYIRETRRMLGKHILTQQDCQDDVSKPQSIGMASYGPDSHHVQRIVYENGEVVNEGNFLEPHKAYEIPMGVIMPKEEECSNLLVPVCVSSSHIAFGSIRMEPVFMIMGQAAATIACLSQDNKMPLHQLKYEVVQNQLLKDKQKLKLKEVY